VQKRDELAQSLVLSWGETTAAMSSAQWATSSQKLLGSPDRLRGDSGVRVLLEEVGAAFDALQRENRDLRQRVAELVRPGGDLHHLCCCTWN